MSGNGSALSESQGLLPAHVLGLIDLEKDPSPSGILQPSGYQAVSIPLHTATPLGFRKHHVYKRNILHKINDLGKIDKEN